MKQFEKTTTTAKIRYNRSGSKGFFTQYDKTLGGKPLGSWQEAERSPIFQNDLRCVPETQGAPVFLQTKTFRVVDFPNNGGSRNASILACLQKRQ